MKKAMKKSVKKLQRIFDFLGKYGGTIKTKRPGTWWLLYVDVDNFEVEGKITSQIGVFTSINGDVIFDPEFKIQMLMDGEKIKDVDIMYYDSASVLGTFHIDGNDMCCFMSMTGCSEKEKDDYGLADRFEAFLTNMVEVGPYLFDPAEVKKYSKYMSE